MDIFEFELRYNAYTGLNYKFDLGRDLDTIINLVKITDRGKTDKKLQDITPAEIHDLTMQTYTNFKNDFIEANKTKLLYPDQSFTLADYINRLEYELKVIKQMGFNTYFLIVADYVKWSKQHDVMVGPGRGSGAGSILAWLIDITDIDPLPFGLLFERFLNPARVSMPDFDIDFEDTQRDRVIGHIREKYGDQNVCSIGTFMKMATKAAFKDAARALGLGFDKSNKFSSFIEDKTPITVSMEKEGFEEMKSMYDNDEIIKQAVKFGEHLEGNMRQLGVHACGIIIAPNVVNTFSPIQYVKEDDHSIVSQYDGPTMEKIGLLKMDFLGLRNLSIIKNCIKIIKKRYEKEGKTMPKMFEKFFVDMSFQPDINDKFTYDKVFKEGDTSGIFQFESNGMKKYLIQLAPEKIDNLVAMNALYRPGPMEFIPAYINRKTGVEPIKYMSDELREIITKQYGAQVANDEEKKLIEDLSPIMGDTYGIAIYQEQLMFLVQNMAGFSLGEADMLRRGIGKKKREVIEKLKIEFTERGQEFRGYKPETTKYIYEKMIEPAASYSFNKSHAVCYAWIAYQTAYLKAHFPVEFYAALIRSVEEDTDEQSKYIYETQNHGITVLPPDINESYNHVAAIDSNIRMGFLGIKGIGFDVGEFIQQERQRSGSYTSLENFLKRCDKVINKKSMEGLIKSGALDKFGDRNTLLNNMDTLLEWSKSSQNISMGLFGGDESTAKISFQKTYTTTFEENLMLEQDVFKCFISGNLLDGLYKYLKRNTFISQINNEKFVGPFQITGYISNIQRAKKKGFFIEIEDISGKREFFVKELLDFNKFDMVIVSGYKNQGRFPKFDKIIKTNREILIKNAGGSYDPEMTVTKAKGLRLGEVKMELLEAEDIDMPKVKTGTNTDDGEDLVDTNTEVAVSEDMTESATESNLDIDNGFEVDDIDEIEDTVSQPKADLFDFDIPNNLQAMAELKNILTQCIGDIRINIGGIEKGVSQEGLEKIRDLLTS